ncbi:hypothetical protein [Ralstonia pseudosolanacearum]|uniref:hypothetical protein n=1 Tax=Ralstonia pseudosolanacearum TaxID=1310165 RepID=UPI00048FDB5D|nr:hypothetical protein [Ralstonia pseudosolanacearum]MDO3558283.1 hypothetical protein [Ralstonia pseudosolanacearum]MDO3575524.1 hypothetical protein [Ralstonia pseudosolanacearum]MDO3586896.1 hypothetical protein [Ralstonia pseudosolanacearum]
MSDDDYMAHAWRVADHLCAACFARVLVRRSMSDERWVFRCSNCGTECIGEDVTVMCACGLPAIECRPNENISAEWPGQIVAQALQD